MSAAVRGLPIVGSAGAVHVSPGTYGPGSDTPGVPRIAYSRHGDGWHGVELFATGRAGAYFPPVYLEPRSARRFGQLVIRAAAHLEAAEAEARGGPVADALCLCDSAGHLWTDGEPGLCPMLTDDHALGLCVNCWKADTGTTHTYP